MGIASPIPGPQEALYSVAVTIITTKIEKAKERKNSVGSWKMMGEI